MLFCKFSRIRDLVVEVVNALPTIKSAIDAMTAMI